MSYVASQAISAKGVQLSINTGTLSTPTMTPVYELSSIGANGYEWKLDDPTNLNSAAIERLATIQDGGTWDLAGNWIVADAGQVAMEAAFASGAVKQFQIVFPKTPGQTTSGDKFAFSAIVQKWSPAVSGADKKIGNSSSLATSNGVTFTAGA